HKVPIQIEEAKVTNLRIASPKISNIIIKPGEVFSFWNLIGRCTEKEGYQMGLMIHNDGELKKGTGGGLCQFSNLIHWMILHTPLEIVEKHH
ncbi:VanW family protein, partial [Klebsiella pneumoniae]|uniref:VanW family protein n=2 Tax=Bacteria TaxID=2 RepID=UPI0034D15899